MNAHTPIANETIATELATSLPKMRFFAEKSADIESVDIISAEAVVRDHPTAPDVDFFLTRVHTSLGDSLYQLPIAWSRTLPDGAEHSVLVTAEDTFGYDALVDGEAILALGQLLVDTGHLGTARLHYVPGTRLEPIETGRAMGVEQSNTSVIFNNSVMCKFFRRLHPGTNADVELLSALSQADCTAVPRLFGWTEFAIDGEGFTTAMLQEFVPNSADGWAMALTSVRDAIREPDTALELLGTDFGAESEALGEAVAAVHHSLAASLPAKRRVSGAELVAPMRERLQHVSAIVPEISELYDAAERVFAKAEQSIGAEGVVVQRIHGDLHLGQVLRTPRNWRLLDFEGEPSRPWEERRLPDHPLRDIAGMLRSFDYAAHYPLLTSREEDSEARPRVEAWADRNIEKFLAGYDATGDSALLDAFVLDKAIYECLYEAQNRPDWLELPLTAVRKLLK